MKSKAQDKANKKKMRIRRIDNHNRFALDFFWKYGSEFFKAIKYDSANGKIEILRVGFVGFGEYAYEFLKVLCCLGQLPRCRLIVYIFDKNAKDRKAGIQKELLANCANKDEEVAPGLNSLTDNNKRILKESDNSEINSIYYHDYPFYEIHFVECDVEKSEFFENCFINKGKSKIPFNHMLFMLGSDEANINVATKVSIAYHRNFTQEKIKKSDPKFYVMVKNDNKTEQLEEKNNLFKKMYPEIILIGSDSEMYSFDTIMESDIEKCGIQVHKYYSFNKEFWKYYDLAKDKSNNLDLSNIKEFKEFVDKIKEFVAIFLKEDYATHSLCSNIDIQNWGALEDKIMERVVQKDLYSMANITIDTKLIKKSKQLDEVKFNKLLAEITELSSVEGKSTSEDKKAKLKKKEAKLKKELEEMLKPYFEKYLEPIKWLYDSERLEEDYNRQEYYRRSSKSRALFEKMLLQLGYLTDEKGKIKPHNVVSEFGITEEDWKLPKEPNDEPENFDPKNIPSYKNTKPNDMKSAFGEEGEVYKSYIEIINKKSPIDHINVQWFEVNNILQKRWMVFRWGEGYVPYGSNDGKTENKEIDLRSKKHKFLRPYIYIYADDEMRIRHTIDITYPRKAQYAPEGKLTKPTQNQS